MILKNIMVVALLLLLSGCATITPQQAMQAVSKHTGNSEVVLMFVNSSNNQISDALEVAALKVTASTDSQALAKVLTKSDKTAVAVAGGSNMVTRATIERAIKDAGTALPKNGKLIIVGNLNDFASVVSLAKTVGLTVEVVPPIHN